jgi:hypothetical protein
VNDVPLGKLGATQLVEREVVISGEWRHESFPIRFRVTRRGGIDGPRQIGEFQPNTRPVALPEAAIRITVG